ncbi:MAG TPA: hypothetical protein VKX33_10550 [Cyclobacteriaceae bacterium]|nr:hypothetical protein [Cyclobacteriaceae bacterium]
MVSELKLHIIRKVAAITEESVLEDIDRLLNLASDSGNLYELTNEEKEAVEAGLKDIKDKKMHSSEEADKIIKAWLNG